MPAGKRARQLPLALGAGARPEIRGGGFLRWIELARPRGAREFPFSIPALRKLRRLEFHPAVTFFIGENGAGKSTLLEAIAVKAGFSAEGGWKRRATEEVHPSSGLDRHLTLARGAYPSDGWFLRAESFFNVATELEEIESLNKPEYRWAGYGGRSPHTQSHGESFLALLNHRLTGDGLYFFDEPEAALSPQRQLSVLTLIHRLVRHGSQLVIATHSPILLAYPHARIFEFGDRGILATRYEDTEHFNVTRDFLSHPQRMLDILLAEEEG
jgi:predicted ATPase